MPGLRTLQVIALALAGPTLLSAASPKLPVATGPMDGPYPGFEVRYAMDAARDDNVLLALLDRPTVIGTAVRGFRDPAAGGRVLEATGDCEAIYELPLSVIAEVLESKDDQARFGSGILSSHVEEKDPDRTIVIQEVGTTFLGLKFAFLTRSEVWVDHLPGGALGVRARLIDSFDGKLYESFSSWYLEPLEIRGRNLTYVRVFMRSGLRNPFPGAEAVMRSFIPIQSKDLIEKNIAEARKRLVAKR